VFDTETRKAARVNIIQQNLEKINSVLKNIALLCKREKNIDYFFVHSAL
jgi:hypothetical protein